MARIELKSRLNWSVIPISERGVIRSIREIRGQKNPYHLGNLWSKHCELPILDFV